MTVSYDWLKLDEAEQISFVMYGSYEEQMQFLTDEQLGRLIRNAMHYVRTGEQKITEPIIDMMLSVMANDIRNQKRNQRKRSDAGRAGGEASAKAKEEKKADGRKSDKKGTEKSAETIASESFNECERPATIAKQYVDVEKDEDVEMDMDGYEDGNADGDDKENQHYYYNTPQRAGAGRKKDQPFPFGRDRIPTTHSELEKIFAFARKLMRTYRNKKTSEHDREKVFSYVHTVGSTDTCDHCAVFSQSKADLLDHVFQVAANQSDMSWHYIDRIYVNYDKHNVTNVEEAVAYEKAWVRGEISA